jgi:hypothetical protein
MCRADRIDCWPQQRAAATYISSLSLEKFFIFGQAEAFCVKIAGKD